MKKSPLLYSFAFLIVASASSQAQVVGGGLNLRSVDFFWRDAVETYTMESEDYAESLQTTLQELKYWRLKVLQDKFEVRISDLEIVLSKSNQEELRQMENYVAKKGLDSLDDSLMMRLAQLHYDRANFDLAVKMKKIKESGDFSHGMPTPDYAKTVNYTSEIIKRFPSSSVLDHAYYLLGYCLFDQGKDKEAGIIYERMLKLFPHSSLSYEARWRMAEQYFERNQFDQAKKAYEGLIEIGNPFSAKALYKLGASEYSSGAFDKAAKIFIKLYKESAEKLGSQDPEAGTLYNEAIDYLAHLKAKDFPMDLNEETDSLVTRRLAEVYRHAQDEGSARGVELKFVNARPLSKWSPGLLNQAIESFEYQNNHREAQKVRSQFLTTYAPQAEFWSKHASDVPTIVEVQDLYESILLSSADFYASQARTNKSEDDYRQAINYYLKFIDEYQSSPLRNQAKYEMADLQFFSKRYADASATYMDMTADTENDEFREEAAYGYLLSEVKRTNFDIHMAKKLSVDRDKNGILKPVSEITKEESEFINASEFFLRSVRKGARRQKVLYKRAEVYFKHNDFARTRENLELIFKDAELSAVASKALILLAATYNVENNWTKVVQTTKRAAEMARRQNFESIDNEMLFKAKSPTLLNAWKAEKRGDYYEAVDLYEHYSLLYPRSVEAPFSLLRAGQIYREMGQIQNSNRILKRLSNDHPENDYQSRVAFFLAANTESQLDFEGAAKGFDDVARRFPKTEIGLQALLSSGYLRKAMGQHESAAKLFLKYATLAQDDTMFFRAASLFQDAGKNQEANKIYGKFIAQKKDPSLAVQAYFEKAYATKDITVANESCAEAEKLSRRARKGLTASAIHNLEGCEYVKSRFVVNKIIKSKGKGLDKKWPTLQKYYGRILENNDDLWMLEVTKDLQKLRKFGKNEEIDKTVADFKTKMAERYVEDYNTKILPDQKRDPETLAVYWPIESSLARVAYDQKKWIDLEKNAKIELTIKPQGYLFMALARAQAEKQDWPQAIETLEKCVAVTKDQACSAALVVFDPKATIPQWKFPSDDESFIKFASMVGFARKNNQQQVAKAAKESVQLDPQFPGTYKYLASYFNSQGKDELALITLEQGLRNTSNDERLLVQKGYLALRMGDLEAAQIVEDELKFSGKNTTDALIFRSHFAYFKGEKETAQNILNQIKSLEPGNLNVDEALRTQAIWTNGGDETRLPAEEFQ